MKLIFPNLQNDEGKTICQLFAVDFLTFLRKKDVNILKVDLINMECVIDNSINLDDVFCKYIDSIIFDSLKSYSYTIKMLKRGKTDISKKVKDTKKSKRSNKISQFTKNIFESSEENIIFNDNDEALFAAHVEALYLIKNKIKDYRCVQSDDEVGDVCNVCGLVEGKKGTTTETIITERISLVGDKCWKQYKSDENLPACTRCSYVLGLISNMRFLWRVNIYGKKGETRYVVVPKYNTSTTDPSIIDEINKYHSYFGLFRTKSLGTTSIDYILNSLKAQPIISKIVADRKINFNVFIQSKSTMQGGYITENILGPNKIQMIAEFASFLNEYFPKIPYADRNSAPRDASRIISEAAYIYTTKGKNAALQRFFDGMKVDFEIILKIIGGGSIKVEYFKGNGAIQTMDDYEWDNPLVRISTFFVVERAYQANKDGKKSEQAINSPMALFNSIPLKEKSKIVRKYVDQITDGGKSPILNRIDRSEDFLTEFIKALNECRPDQLKEIARFMRIFANMYQYKKTDYRDKIVSDTIEKLGYSFKQREVNA